MVEWCEVCKTREAWSRNLKHPICARCGVLAWQKLSDDAEVRPTPLALDTATPSDNEAALRK